MSSHVAPDDGPPPRPALTFVIPVRNDATRLRRCLESIAADDRGPAFEVIVMDHGSRDDSATVARALGARVVTRTAGNVSSLRNEGAALATAPLLAFVDADHEIAPGWRAAACEGMADPAVAAVGAPCHPPHDGTWVQHAYDALRRHPRAVEPAEWFGAGNMVVRRDAFQSLGGFDTSFETCEDADLCFRLRNAGWTLMSHPGLVNVHLGDPPTLGRLFKGELWRGRDNLRVSWRAPFSIRNLASMLIPVAQLGAVVVALAAAWLPWPLAGFALGLAVLTVTAPVAARTVAMRQNSGGRTPLGDVLAVALTYDAARAAALLARAAHHRDAPQAAGAAR